MKKVFGCVEVLLCALFLTGLASCSSTMQYFGVNGVIVSHDGVTYTDSTADLEMDVSSADRTFSFTATSKPVENGYPIKITVINEDVAQVVQDEFDLSHFTIKGLKTGYSDIIVNCAAYNFTFVLYVTDRASGVTKKSMEESHFIDSTRRAIESDKAKYATIKAGTYLPKGQTDPKKKDLVMIVINGDKWYQYKNGILVSACEYRLYGKEIYLNPLESDGRLIINWNSWLKTGKEEARGQFVYDENAGTIGFIIPVTRFSSNPRADSSYNPYVWYSAKNEAAPDLASSSTTTASSSAGGTDTKPSVAIKDGYYRFMLTGIDQGLLYVKSGKWTIYTAATDEDWENAWWEEKSSGTCSYINSDPVKWVDPWMDDAEPKTLNGPTLVCKGKTDTVYLKFEKDENGDYFQILPADYRQTGTVSSYDMYVYCGTEKPECCPFP